MTVIAKMNVASVREFGAAELVKLSCVYESDGLNASDKGWEDRRFTTATPWGEADLTTPHTDKFREKLPGEGWEKQQSVYLVFVPVAELDSYVLRSDCLVALRVKAKRREDTGYTRQVELVLDRDHHEGTPGLAFNGRMAIDNPAASDHFSDGAEFYMVLYDAAATTLAEAANGQ